MYTEALVWKMPIDATIFCIDNSSYARNCDYINGSRLAHQIETMKFLANARIRNSQESSVGYLSMAGMY